LPLVVFLIIFIVLAKIKTVFKSFNVNVVKDNGLLRVLLNQDLITISIHLVLRCGKATFLHHDYQLIHTSLVLTRDVIIISLCLSWLKFPILLQAPLIWKSLPLREWDILFTLSLLLLLFISLTILLLERLVSIWNLSVKLRFLMLRSVIGVKDLLRLYLMPLVLTKNSLASLSQDEWHFDETYIKINGKDYYVWFALDLWD